MAGLWETLAFFFRALSSRDQQSRGIYLTYQLFILLAPLCKSTPALNLTFHFLTISRGQRIRIHGPRPHDPLLHALTLPPLNSRIPHRRSIRTPRLHILRNRNCRRRIGRTFFSARRTTSGIENLHGWHRITTILHCGIRWVDNQVSERLGEP